MRLVGERVAGGRVLQTDRGRNVAGPYLIDVLTPDGVHAQDAADPLLASVRCGEHARTGLQPARVNPEERQLADPLGIHLDLDGERRKRLVTFRLLDGRRPRSRGATR